MLLYRETCNFPWQASPIHSQLWKAGSLILFLRLHLPREAIFFSEKTSQFVTVKLRKSSTPKYFRIVYCVMTNQKSKIILLVFVLFWVSSEITKVKEFIHPAFFVCRVCLISRALTSSHMETSNLPTAWWITAGYLRLLITDSQLLGTNKRKFTHLIMRITEVNVKY